jgi:hypothetical protein
VLLTAAAVLAPAPAMAALGLSVSTPTVALALRPGQTATGSGTLVVTPGIGTWQLSVADLTGHKGHLAKGITCPSYAEAQTTNALTVQVTGPLSTSSGTKTVSDVAQTVATGALTDTLTDNLALVVASNEAIPTICTFSTTLTYTLQ